MLPDKHNDTLPVRSTLSPTRQYSDSQAAIRARLEVMHEEQALLERNRARMAARRQHLVTTDSSNDELPADVRRMHLLGGAVVIAVLVSLTGLAIVIADSMGWYL